MSDLRKIFNGPRWLVRTREQWHMLPLDRRLVLQSPVTELAAPVQDATRASVELASIDLGDTGEQATADAADYAIRLG